MSGQIYIYGVTSNRVPEPSSKRISELGVSKWAKEVARDRQRSMINIHHGQAEIVKRRLYSGLVKNHAQPVDPIL
ncbi:uncharacterized protein N7459_002456 [Penicillium hispanicum]|uniref:uncharacterized protein n=1 Tax=Penicillium hispanicum TaxID=1080232 RepID=UPI002541E7ED|nr:uncharacterized protein N7459_002456 [Penicillium hispanicum]KAJ5586691.1 hypothetical protein N7459_002456 [Penicillium hispanicum]